MIITLAVVTMTLANMMAIVQEDVKRMLAYSSISHAGFVMAALALGTTKGNSSIFLYYGLFLFTNLGAFAMLWISRHKKKPIITDFITLYEKVSPRDFGFQLPFFPNLGWPWLDLLWLIILLA